MGQDESSQKQETEQGVGPSTPPHAVSIETTVDDIDSGGRQHTPRADFVHSSASTSGEALDSLELELRGVFEETTKRPAFRADEVVGGHFKIVRSIGEGGMGAVFAAKDTKLGRRVALKTLKVPQGLDEEQQARFNQLFHRDAASTARLNHPNIVTVYQFGDHEGTPFMVLEFVDGLPLDMWLQSHGPMDEREALMLALQTAEALDYAHAQGVIHRDIKPANLMRTKGGRLKVLDFGVALMRQAQEDLIEDFDRTPSQLGEHLGEEPRAAGTPAYMAPEQIRGLLQDERVDVWAFGVTLYELLTGGRPYVSPWHIDEHFRVFWPEDIPLSASTKQLVEGCLKPHQSERPRRMTDVIDPLRESIGDLGFLGFGTRTNLAASGELPEELEDEFAELDELLVERGERLVTLTGADIEDKVALLSKWGLDALEREKFTQVLMCDLAEVTSPQGIAAVMADALRVTLDEDTDPVEQITRELAQSDGLVFLLDRAEEALDALTPLITLWLDEAPSVRFVLTSGNPTDISSERLVSMGVEHPLAPPAPTPSTARASWPMAAALVSTLIALAGLAAAGGFFDPEPTMASAETSKAKEASAEPAARTEPTGERAQPEPQRDAAPQPGITPKPEQTTPTEKSEPQRDAESPKPRKPKEPVPKSRKPEKKKNKKRPEKKPKVEEPSPPEDDDPQEDTQKDLQKMLERLKSGE